MSLSKNSQPPSQQAGTILIFIVIGLCVSIAVPLWAAVALGSALDGVNEGVRLTPITVLFGLGKKVTWPGSATWILVVFGLVLVAAIIGIMVLRQRIVSARTRVDVAATSMAGASAHQHVSKREVAATATRLGVDPEKFGPGLPLGIKVGTNMWLYSSWEELRTHIWRMRTGKSSSMVIPSVMCAPGAVVTTSNKRDVHDATRLPRSRRGQVWVFDPQGVVGESPTWWWNPLSVVVDDVSAMEMAEHFASATKTPGASEDSYFDPEGRELLSCLFLAAALADRPIQQVFTWTTRTTDDEPMLILRQHGWDGLADSIAGILATPEKQKAGVYGTAKKMAACLKLRALQPWISKQSVADARPQLDVNQFVRSTDTLYSMSMEGPGSAGAIVTALTAFTANAAVKLASRSAGGRMPVPIVFSLDEVANVCRWYQLPQLYSHFGSRGIIIEIFLQTWSQGVQLWGESGMKTLWAANHSTFGGGNEIELLKAVSELIGDTWTEQRSVSHSRTGNSVSISRHRQPIMDIAALGEMPKGRAVILIGGAPPALIRTVPWLRHTFADEVRESIMMFDPEATETLAEAERELAAVEAELEAAA